MGRYLEGQYNEELQGIMDELITRELSKWRFKWYDQENVDLAGDKEHIVCNICKLFTCPIAISVSFTLVYTNNFLVI